MKANAIVLANGHYHTIYGKTAHGLVRGGTRFRVLAVVDPDLAGQEAGELLDGKQRNIPVVHSIREAMEASPEKAEYCVVGIAIHGGRFAADLRKSLLEAVQSGMSIVNGLHEFASDDAEIASAARRQGVEIIDLRRSPPKHELHFWTGEILKVQAPRIAVLGMDCAIGKRTTAWLLAETLKSEGVRAEMIYTGQTGWMQGVRYGFLLDSTYNDFVCGELEHAIVTCDREAHPEVMLLEGQASLRNPCGPCGSEFLLSGGARGVILLHAPGREFFDGFEERGLRIPPIEEELSLISLYGARTLAIALHGHDLGPDALSQSQGELQEKLGIPVIRPLEEGVEALVPVVRRFIEEERS